MPEIPKSNSESEDTLPKLEEEKFTTLGEFLKKIRKEKKELLRDIATRVSLTPSVFSQIETGYVLPRDLNNIIEAYQLTEEQIGKLKKIHQIETVINAKDIEGEKELTNQEEVLKNTLGKKDDDPSIAAEKEEDRQKEKEQFEIALKKLHKRDRRVIELRFGLGKDGKTHTLEEVGKIIGISKSSVKQIEARALSRLGGVLNGRQSDEP